MTQQGYLKITAWFQAHPRTLRLMKILNRWLPLCLYAAYPVLLLVLAFLRDSRIWKVVFIPAAVFILVTILRKFVNAKRPYELLGVQPLIPKNKRGESFPSRHVASAFILALAFWYINLPLGLLVMLIALLIAVIRPLAGIHFPRDVIASALLSLVLGIPAFLLLPF